MEVATALTWLTVSVQDGSDWMGAHVATFSAVDPLYSLPNNVAIITLQVRLESSSMCKDTDFF